MAPIPIRDMTTMMTPTLSPICGGPPLGMGRQDPVLEEAGDLGELCDCGLTMVTRTKYAIMIRIWMIRPMVSSIG